MNWPPDEMARVRNCTVRIVQTDGGGSGFFIAPRLIATCAHVLFDGDRPVPSQLTLSGRTVDVDFRGVLRAVADDVALISTSTPRDDFLPVDADLQVGDRIYAWGFPDDYREGDSVTVEYEGPTRTEHPLLKLKGGQIRPGMSGAPLVNQRTGRVCGMISRTRDRRSALGGRGIPATTLQSLVPTLEARRGVGSAVGYGWRQMSSRLALVRDELRTRKVSGSTRLTLDDLLRPGGILMPFRAQALGALDHATFDPAAESADTAVRPVLVLAPPGAGKSTFAYTIFVRLAQTFIDDPDNQAGGHKVPFFIDLRDYREAANQPGFGSLTWLRERLDEVVGTSGLFRWSRISDTAEGGISADAFIILDSLDELLSGRAVSRMTAILDRPMFRRANVICCRTQFYDRYLATVGPFGNSDAVELVLPENASINRYVVSYYSVCFPEMADGLAGRFRQRLESSPELASVCRVPLRLNMALDLLSPGTDDIPADSDLLGLYHAYLTGLLHAEAGKHGSVLMAEQKIRVLEELAWHFYDEGNMGSTDAPPFTDMEFDRFMAQHLPERSFNDRSRIAEDLRTHSVLKVDGSMFSSIQPGTMSFVHKSFQEYLIARWLYNMMSTSAEHTAVAFRQYMSPEVDEFLKEYLRRTRRTPRLLSVIARNCIDALQVNESAQVTSDGRARARMAREQLGYFLGGMNLPFATEFLRGQLGRETDPWLRRGITCGLAIGGNEQYLHAYVEKLRAERAGPPPYEENEVNLGFHLSFCGDQPFEPLAPEHDQGMDSCSRAIRRMVYQLGTEVDRGNWRLNLYTVIDFWRNRPVSRESARRTLLELRPQLTLIIDGLSADDRCRWWPEIAELRELIAELDGGAVPPAATSDPAGRPIR